MLACFDAILCDFDWKILVHLLNKEYRLRLEQAGF